MRHESNLDFRTIKDWLVSETQNHALGILFLNAYQLHRNFYRIALTREEIEFWSQDALDLADAARPFAQSPTP